MVGIVDKEGVPIKKPWAIQTDCDSIVVAFDGLSCDGSHTHVQGRGTDLKETESYSFQMTGLIHQASLQRTAQDLDRLQQLCVLFRFQPRLQWPTIDDSLKPR